MRYGLDGRTIQDRFPSIGRYAYALALALPAVAPDDEFVLIHDPRVTNTRHDLSRLASWPNVSLVPEPTDVRALAQQWRLPALARRLGLDVYHSTYYVMPYRLPCRSVVTVHDLIPALDVGRVPIRGAFWRAIIALAGQRADIVLTGADATRDELVRRLGLRPRDVHAVPLGVGPEFHPRPAAEIDRLRMRLRLPEQYALFVGNQKPHKNLVRLVYAWHALAQEVRRSHRLVIAGSEDRRYPQVRAAVAHLGLGEEVSFAGPIASEDLPVLYAGAKAFVLPSLYEGFGLPVLEAMASGTPVACARIAPLEEVAAGAALLFEPSDIAALRDTLQALLADADRRAALIAAGRERARQFTWEETAIATVRVYRDLLGEPRAT